MTKLILALAVMFSAGYASAASKFGVVDMQQAILKTKAGKSAKASMEAEIKKRRTAIEKLQKDFQTKQKDFQKKSIAWSDDLKAKKGAELQRDGLKIQETMYKNQQELQRKELSLKKPIIDNLRKAISAVAKRGSYTMIFEGAEDKVLYVSSKNDITDEVVKEFEKINKK